MQKKFILDSAFDLIKKRKVMQSGAGFGNYPLAGTMEGGNVDVITIGSSDTSELPLAGVSDTIYTADGIISGTRQIDLDTTASLFFQGAGNGAVQFYLDDYSANDVYGDVTLTSTSFSSGYYDKSANDSEVNFTQSANSFSVLARKQAGHAGLDRTEIELTKTEMSLNFGGTGEFQLDGVVGTAGQVFTSGGADAPPVWSTPTAVSDYTGWAQYDDTTYTTGAALALADGVSVDLPNDKGSVIESQMPVDIVTMYDGTVIPGRNGDGILVAIEFKVRPTSVAVTRIRTSIDIGGAIGEIFTREFTLSKGNGVEHYFSSSTAGYTLGTWETNGGTPKIVSLGGAAEVYDIRYIITRTHKAR